MLTASMLAAGLISCEKTGLVSYSRFEKIGSEGWNPEDVISFEPTPADTAESRETHYEMELVLRYSLRSGERRIPIVVNVEDENGQISSDTVAALDPDWKEKASYGVREISRVVSADMKLTDGYAVSVNPLAPREYSRGLLNVGLKLTRIN